MKGDLNTLKKVCKYASIVMKIGEVVFGGLIIATVVMGAAALFFDALEEAFYDWIGMKATDEMLKVVSMFIVTLFSVDPPSYAFLIPSRVKGM